MRFAPNALATPASGIREFVHLVIEAGHGVVRLEVGESALPTPAHVIDAAHQAALDGYTRYTASAGFGDLREAICGKLRRVNGLEVEARNVVVTTGAIEGVFLALSSLCAPGDEVLCPDPGWPNYEMICTLIGARCVAYPCRPERGFAPDPAELGALVTDRTRVLIVNSPNNPTGAVYPPEVLRGLVHLARTRGLVLLSDETYDELYFGDPPVSALAFDDPRDGAVVAVFSFSKTYAMTGWRVGYAVGPQPLIDLMAKLQEPVNSCVGSVSQRAALAALLGPQAWVERQRAELARRRDAVARVLDAASCRYRLPDGSFYLWLDVAPWKSLDLAHALLETERVAVAPGSAFGREGEGYVRLCFAALPDDAGEVVGRVAGLVRAGPSGAELTGDQAQPSATGGGDRP